MSALLSPATKKTFARDLFGKSEPPEQDESIADFVRRKFTPELLDRLVGSFVSGVYAGDPQLLSLRSAFPQVYEAEQSAGSVIRGLQRAGKSSKGKQQAPTLFSFREGNETLIRALQTKLGPAARVGTEVTSINKAAPSQPFELRTRTAGSEETLTTDRLVMAVPTDVAGRLLGAIHSGFDQLLGSIHYAPIAVVSLGYLSKGVAHSLDGFGFLVPRSVGVRLLGTVWNSSLFPNRAPANYSLLTSFIGGATDPGAVLLPAPELAKIVATELTSILKITQPPAFTHVQAYPRALPQYNLGHSDRLKAIQEMRSCAPGLFLAGNYLHGPSIGSCVEHAQSVAAQAVTPGARACAHPAVK